VIVLREEYLIPVPYVLPFLAMVTLPLLGFRTLFFSKWGAPRKVMALCMAQ